MNLNKATKVNSKAEELFIQLFCEVFGPDKAGNLYVQYPFVDIYGKNRFIDFALENHEMKVAIEIDGETYHNPKKVSDTKYYDDLLKQNSLIYDGWHVYRWAYNQLTKQPEKVKDELVTFLGETPFFKEIDFFLPKQQGRTFELREYQQEAIDNLFTIRESGDSIALLYHATGIGKTVTAASDAKVVNGRTLFLVHNLKLADQAEDTFAQIWPEATRGYYTGIEKNLEAKVIFATVQSVSNNVLSFEPKDFDYIIVDECHHTAAKTYQQIFSYFEPKFILGLTATPERADGEDILQLFQNVAHKMDLKTAVEREILAPIRCIRVKTDIDLTEVRINGIKYNAQDLESKLFIPERNQLIVDTYLKYAKGKKTVIFCANVNHAEDIAHLLQEQGVHAAAVSSRENVATRERILKAYEEGDIHVLSACDLLNEGWDSPCTEVLFMARPTMSKVIYMQQLGRGTRKYEGKESLLVFDFVDNANMFNMPYSLHRLLDVGEYKPNEYVLAPSHLKKLDEDMLRRGERPDAYLDVPIDVDDYEVIDLFNWKNEVKEMKSQLEFVRMVDVQTETVERYVREGKIVPDLAVPIGDTRTFNYYKEDTIKEYAKTYNWDLITSANIVEKFMAFIEKMDMSYSYKPVLIKAMLEYADERGRVDIDEVVNYFIEFYEGRKVAGLVAEKANSLYQKGNYMSKDVEKNILSNPFKRFSDMRFLQRNKAVNLLEFNPVIFKKLTSKDKERILAICDEKLMNYYTRLEN